MLLSYGSWILRRASIVISVTVAYIHADYVAIADPLMLGRKRLLTGVRAGR